MQVIQYRGRRKSPNGVPWDIPRDGDQGTVYEQMVEGFGLVRACWMAAEQRAHSESFFAM